MIEFKERVTIGLLVLFLLAVPVWIYFNRYYVLQRLFPFRSLENKVALDGIDILDWADDADSGEIYLIDTLRGVIRQLTYDSFIDERPAVSEVENRIYFLSYRPAKVNQDYPNRQRRLFYVDMANQQVFSADREFGSILQGTTSEIGHVSISNGRMALIEYYDSARLYLIDLDDKVLLNHWTVRAPVTIVSFNDKGIVTRQYGEIRNYETSVRY